MFEFGKLSPIGVSCYDQTIKLEDLQISKTEIHVLQRLFNHDDDDDDIHVSEEDKMLMEKLDKYLDIPLVQAILDESASYSSFHRLVENDCTLIPKKYKQNPELVKETIVHHSFKAFQKAISYCSNDIHFLKLAIRHGCIDIVKFLLKIFTKEEEEIGYMCALACKYGHVECLQVLHKNGFPWNDLAASLAASYGKLDCLRYMHENGYILCMDVRAAAFMNNQQECLQYVIDHGCPWIEGYISVLYDFKTDLFS